uniref:30S ribosomal protein S6-like protein, putative n=1 Tax=Babesia bovis TaxID=5865 RepID=S6BDZ6_BABBO|nr:30S ribosomal protein S6-like protein, putative [Babesia bovis]
MLRTLLCHFFLLTAIVPSIRVRTLNNNLRADRLSFIVPGSHIDKRIPHLQFKLYGRLTHELYKTIRQRIIQCNETTEKRRERLERIERGKRDGLLLSPKTSYNIYLLLDTIPADKIKQRFQYIAHNLINIGAENIHIYYYGVKKLAQPLKKKHEPSVLSFELCVYPSLIKHIHSKLKQEDHVLRVLVLKDEKKDKDLRIYRDNNLHIRHPYFNAAKFSSLKGQLVNKPQENFDIIE